MKTLQNYIQELSFPQDLILSQQLSQEDAQNPFKKTYVITLKHMAQTPKLPVNCIFKEAKHIL